MAALQQWQPAVDHRRVWETRASSTATGPTRPPCPVNTLLSIALTTSGVLTNQQIDATEQIVQPDAVTPPVLTQSSTSDGAQLLVQPPIQPPVQPGGPPNGSSRPSHSLVADAGILDLIAAVGGGGGGPPPPSPAGNIIVKDTSTGVQQAWSYTPDSNFNITQIQDPQQGLQNFTFDPARNILSFLNENRNLYKFSYDIRRNPTSVTDTANNTTNYQWQNDNLVLRTDPLGSQSKFTYDAHSNPLTVTDEESHTNTYTYLPTTGQLATAQDALGNRWTYKYDANGYLNEVDEPTDNGVTSIWHFVNDLLGRRTQVTDPNGHIWKYTYDLRDRVTQMTLPRLPGDPGP